MRQSIPYKDLLIGVNERENDWCEDDILEEDFEDDCEEEIMSDLGENILFDNEAAPLGDMYVEKAMEIDFN